MPRIDSPRRLCHGETTSNDRTNRL